MKGGRIYEAGETGGAHFQARKIKVKWNTNEPREQRQAGVADGKRSGIRGYLSEKEREK